MNVEFKGNDIDPTLWKIFQMELRTKIINFDPYSHVEEVCIDEEEEMIKRVMEMSEREEKER